MRGLFEKIYPNSYLLRFGFVPDKREVRRHDRSGILGQRKMPFGAAHLIDRGKWIGSIGQIRLIGNETASDGEEMV
ncbi:hypothetical protein HYALB_00010348 [Hymenoscyphus albidus]|uniref:Uncharacterized protein n=1 Tax=Hymenoscyphus albidus TaxID=595503 RepID=A0A9N9PZV3_9HELO|nr:hypothetical protein HYALB_00010348 [Hymenoscyphus albidus]